MPPLTLEMGRLDAPEKKGNHIALPKSFHTARTSAIANVFGG
jgi:hypothetical protein